MSPALGRLLCSLALGAQLLLPVAHALEVFRSEASHPREEPVAGASRLSQGGPRRHHHHDETACAVCPVFSRFDGIAASSAPNPGLIPKISVAAPQAGSGGPSSTAIGSFLSRGPPQS